MSENLPLHLDMETSRKIQVLVEDGLLLAMGKAWEACGGGKGEVDEKIFRAEVGLFLHRLAERELDKAHGKADWQLAEGTKP